MNEIYGYQPCYGERGSLTHIGNKVQCHVCGKAFHHLGNHVVKTHEITADQYCDEFGLKRTTGLISDTLADKRRLTSQFNDPAIRAKAMAAAAVAPRGKRTSKASLQERRGEGYAERKRVGITTAQAEIKRRIADGTYVPPSHGVPEEAARAGRAKWLEMKKDPQLAEEWKRRISEARLQPITRACSVCGAKFITGKTKGKRRTCSAECHAEHRRCAVKVMQQPEVWQRLSATAKQRHIHRNELGQIVSWVRVGE